ncbi:MAG: cyclic nucleotide-binding domain-containing protein [Deltaproteobacteria bacterium]
MKDYDLLVASELLADFSTEELSALAPLLEVANHPAGHVFSEVGDKGHEAYLILSGRVAVTQRRGDSVDRLGELGPGQLFGLVSLIDGGRRTATCTAMEPVRAATLRKAAFDILAKSGVPASRRFQLAVARQLAKDVQRLNGVLLSLSLQASEAEIRAALRR